MKKMIGLVCLILASSFLATAFLGCPPVGPTPRITLTSVPAYGSFDNLQGKVSGVDPLTHAILTFIEVEDVWWTKPYYASPLTLIAADGTFTVDITTGGNDQYATAIKVFLVPKGITPLICGPCQAVANIPEAKASALVNRQPPVRRISLGGYQWRVKKSDFPVGPGPNYFSDETQSVWADSEGIHLTIKRQGDRWLCTEVIIDGVSFGYGTYITETHGRVDILNKNIVFGGFLWDMAAPEYSYREIDFFEFTRWGNASEPTNSQYVVHPCSVCPGCTNCERFRIDLTDQNSDLTHYLVWEPGRAEFRTYYGHHLGSVPSASQLAHSWIFTDSNVPPPGEENVRFNLWLNQGNPPSDGQNEEVIITDFAWQPEPPDWNDGEEGEVTTNLGVYPLTGYFPGSDEVLINDQPVVLDEADGLRYDVLLAVGDNVFTIEPVNKATATKVIRIDYDPSFSTENRTVLYDFQAASGTIAIDLTADCILGLIPNARIVAASNNGHYLVDDDGLVYSAASHQPIGRSLPMFGQPVFSPDDQFVYAGYKKIRFSDGQVVSGQLPVWIDNIPARVVGNTLYQGNWGEITLFDLTTDTVIKTVQFTPRRVLFGSSTVDNTGRFGFYTSYSYAVGSFQVIDLELNELKLEQDGLSDYTGQIAVSTDNRFALVGSYGNSYYGNGGVYVYELSGMNRRSFYLQFGAASVAIDPDNRIYVSTRYVDHFGNGSVVQGDKAKQGIDVLAVDGDGRLSRIGGYFLNEKHAYFDQAQFFIKPGR